MGKKVLMKGNEAIGEAAITAGCRHFFGYPITPQSELPAYLAKRMPQEGGVFLQGESEVASVNMVYGASSAGVRVMTSSSSPGVSLKQEGISYMVGAELPALVCNVQRAGPGLGTIQPAQSDYFQATKGGGHGDYNIIVLSPSSVQEIVDMVRMAFDLADTYRNPCMLLTDGMLGQLMEPVDFGDYKPMVFEKPWALTGCKGRPKNTVTSIYIQPERMEEHNLKLQKKFAAIREKEQRWEELSLSDDTEILVVAHGTMARIVKSAMKEAQEQGVKVGVIRPITVWPFPEKAFRNLRNIQTVLVVEMSAGQMLEDVKLSINGRLPVHFFGRMGGMVPTVEQILSQIMSLRKSPAKL
ncbi:MAG: 3-methyl-2-oxobutanoate dehydrogenase subunit VorB [Candidatus Eremiobacteraeota bacterium]|nr:3-methyl-2-oxobutanoate dehydrogenase subunit VorB [Candidatus Eremiobacteraeota bacterium]